MLHLLVVLSALLALALGTAFSGNLAAGVLAGVAAALAWSALPRLLVRRYLTADLDGTRPWLRLCGAALGPDEALMAEVALAVETQRVDAVEPLLAAAARTHPALRELLACWVAARRARLSGDIRAAVALLQEGAERQHALARAELLAEASLLLFQIGAGADDAETAGALDCLRRAQEAVAGLASAGPRSRYVAAWLCALGGLACLAAGQPHEAEQALSRAVRDLERLASPRPARLAAELRLELIRILHRTERTAAAEGRIQAARTTVRLPGLRVRVEEIAREVARSRHPRPAEPRADRPRAAVTPEVHLDPPAPR